MGQEQPEFPPFEMIPAADVRPGDTISVFGFTGAVVRALEDVPGSPEEIRLHFRNESQSLRLRQTTRVKMLKRAHN